MTSEATLEVYLKEINKTRLLTPEQERELAEKIQKGDGQAREEMVKANLRLVVNIAKHYANLGLPLADIIEEGNIGLLKAVDRFDLAKNCRFSTYATWWIKQAIRRALTDNSKIIRIPSYMRELICKADEAAERIAIEKGTPPTLKEIAATLEKKPCQRKRTEHLLRLSTNLARIQSLDKICEQNDFIEAPVKQEIGINADEMEMLQILLRSLNKKERTILTMRFGIEGGKPMTLHEISQAVKLSRERVRQIIRESLEKLRENVKRKALENQA